MIDLAYYNGVITPYDSACIPLSDRAVFFGDAVYDVILGRAAVPYQAHLHIERLIANAKAIGLSSTPSYEEITDAIGMLLNESHASDFVLYVQLSADSPRRTHSRKGSGTNLLMTVTSANIPDKLEIINAVTLPDLRHGYCNIKTTDLLPSVLSVQDAESTGDEIAIFHKNGTVTEASYANVSMIIANTLVTHPLDSSILPGISQLNLIDACKRLGIAHTERCFTLKEIKEADLLLITSTTKLVKVCARIDGEPLECKQIRFAEQIFDLLHSDLVEKTSR